eukprot:scaffold73524_cov46-Cyclotella_meneghiniana.AAC.1
MSIMNGQARMRFGFIDCNGHYKLFFKYHGWVKIRLGIPTDHTKIARMRFDFIDCNGHYKLFFKYHGWVKIRLDIPTGHTKI